MDAQKASITALVCGFTRAYHAKNDTPKIFDDNWAECLLSPEEYAFMEESVTGLLNLFEPETAGKVDEVTARRLVMQKYNSSTVLSRARFIEDCLEKAISAESTSTSFWEPGWIHSRYAGRNWRTGCGCLKWTIPPRRLIRRTG